MIVTLSDAERQIADRLGIEKHNKSERDGRKADWYDNRGGGVAENHQDGIAAEMCHLKGFLSVDLINDFERKYYRIDTFKMADVGANFEIRSTKMWDWAGKVKDRDKNERIVVFYRKLNRLQFKALGWLTVQEAKNIGTRRDPGNRGVWAYFIRDAQLHSIETLPKD